MLRGPVVRAALAGLLLTFLLGAARTADAVEAADLVEAAVSVRAADTTRTPDAGPAWAEAHGQVRRVVEELRSEIEAMKRIAAAQKELMAWNGERARLGLAAITLRPELCREAEIGKWCRLLPATFGVAEDGR